ncbi:MAG: hypothetical protein FWC60_09275 [Firmicutes bacterium]|nr:hypothetical protein [Bacillota bacterium]
MKKKREDYIFGLAITGLTIFVLVYTLFYTSTFRSWQGPAAAWNNAAALSASAVLAGMLMELGRFWGAPLEFKTDTDLLIFQGIPAAILSVIPGPFWLQLGGHTFPFTFFADPAVTAITGVWLGVVLFRGLFDHKAVGEKGEEEKN